jgi:hypothetical protein
MRARADVRKNIPISSHYGDQCETGLHGNSEMCDSVQLTLLTAIAAFGDSTYSPFISKLKTFAKTLFIAHRLYNGHDHTI